MKKKKAKKRVQWLAMVFGKRVANSALLQERKRCVCVPSTPDGAASVQCDTWWNSEYLAQLVSGSCAD